MEKENQLFEMTSADVGKESSGVDINFKRVLSRVLKYWYVIATSLITALALAWFINRYSPRVYPVRASIIILQNEENTGAKFLYDNELVQPFRNFYNELYIMKSYPLLSDVMEELNFDVSFFREGNIKTTESYDPNFPLEFRVIGTHKPYGRSVNLQVTGENGFSLELLFEDPALKSKMFNNLVFGDTVKINGYSFLIRKRGEVRPLIGKNFLVKFNDPYALARTYSAKLNAGWAQQGASVVNLEVTGEVPEKEIDFLNKFIEKYQQYDVDKKNKMATMAISFLNTQLQFMTDSLNLLEDQVESFKERNVLTNLGSETNRLYLKREQLEEQRFQYRLKENYYNYVLDLLKNEQYDGIFTPASVGVTDDVMSALINSLIGARNQLNRYQGIERQEDNPLYREHQLRIRQIKNDIVKTIQNTKSTQQINLKFIGEQLTMLEKDLRRLPSSERELIDIQRDYSLKEKLYVFLLQKKTEAGLSKASTVSDIVVVNPPLAGAAISPQVDRNYMVAAGAGLFLPLIIFILLELLNHRIQSRDDITKITDVPIVGGIGHNLASDPLIVYNKPRSGIAESFRALRANLSYFTGDKNHQVFMVTSSLPGEGKSFTALNLATVFALAGRRTLIVGADLRKPKLFDELSLGNETGLSQYLSGLAGIDAIIQKSKIANLELIAAGPMPPNPSELLLREEMVDLIRNVRSKFDCVIIDTPPLAFVADAMVLSKHADHTIFVVRQDVTPKGAVRSLNDNYTEGKLSKISILFNDLKKSGPGYGYESYGYSYGYGYYGYGGKKKSGYYDE